MAPPPLPPKPISDVEDDEEEEDDDDVDVSKYKLDSDEVMNNLLPFINYFTCLVCSVQETINSLTLKKCTLEHQPVMSILLQ